MEPFPADIAIVDPHHHLWDLGRNYYPWLTDRITERVCGDYAAIRHNYLIDDFLADIGDLPVVATVHVEAAHDERDPVRETAWLHEVAEAPENPRGFPIGFVVHADLSTPDAGAVLERHCAYPRVRGVRQMLHETALGGEPLPPVYARPAFGEGLGHLARLGLSFDLQLFPEQMEDGARLVASHPDVAFVLCHAGQPRERSDAGLALWRTGLKRLAQYPNVTIKISGLGMFDRTWTVESLRPFVLEPIEIFGPERAMFASNFPVDGMMTSYRRLWAAYAEITRDFSLAERHALFADTARRIYRV